MAIVALQIICASDDKPIGATARLLTQARHEAEGEKHHLHLRKQAAAAGDEADTHQAPPGALHRAVALKQRSQEGSLNRPRRPQNHFWHCPLRRALLQPQVVQKPHYLLAHHLHLPEGALAEPDRLAQPLVQATVGEALLPAPYKLGCKLARRAGEFHTVCAERAFSNQRAHHGGERLIQLLGELVLAHARAFGESRVIRRQVHWLGGVFTLAPVNHKVIAHLQAVERFPRQSRLAF